MENNCLFCEIVSGNVPSTKVYEDEYVFAFNDINPQAPVHVIIIPKAHIVSAQCIDSNNSLYVAKCFEAIALIASKLGLDNGYRIINNCGNDGGQTVEHLHFHLLAGRKLGETLV